MLTEERFEKILEIIEKDKTVTVSDLTKLLGASESTVRRDLNELDKKGQLIKVHGGAMRIDCQYNTKDDDVLTRKALHMEEKNKIADYAASLIGENDFIYLDAGTTVECMIDAISGKNIIFITNCLGHARKLCEKGFSVYLPGGMLKTSTDALVGEEAIRGLDKYNFTKGFFGTNGINPKSGYSTPDIQEALVKQAAMARCRQSYILSDPSKFNRISSVTFGAFEDATVITTKLEDMAYRDYQNIVEVSV
jgi:DeoR family fructose operon transcriptional repressor